ncbi:PepSY domain-containing protein [Xanthomonas bundabergensis]|uniref:PepSY domain-containing protein n=1 Tax=Xanthomonas bundabergensis TaxID=3160842 RepID=UPI0035146615
MTAALTAAGYTQVHDVHYDEGLWEAQARTSTGQRVELRADPGDGSVVSAQED